MEGPFPGKQDTVKVPQGNRPSLGRQKGAKVNRLSSDEDGTTGQVINGISSRAKCDLAHARNLLIDSVRG